MSLIAKSVRAAPLLAKSLQVQPVRGLQAIPSRNRWSTPKLVLFGGGLVVSWLTIPAYILVNMKYYNGTVPRE